MPAAAKHSPAGPAVTVSHCWLTVNNAFSQAWFKLNKIIEWKVNKLPKQWKKLLDDKHHFHSKKVHNIICSFCVQSTTTSLLWVSNYRNVARYDYLRPPHSEPRRKAVTRTKNIKLDFHFFTSDLFWLQNYLPSYKFLSKSPNKMLFPLKDGCYWVNQLLLNLSNSALTLWDIWFRAWLYVSGFDSSKVPEINSGSSKIEWVSIDTLI